MGADLGELPFDTVTVTVDGQCRIFSPADLLALPLHTRVRWLLDESLEFRRGPTLVDRRDALAALRIALSVGRVSGRPTSGQR